MRVTVVLLFLLLLCGAAWGAHPLDAEMEKCMNEDPSTHGVIRCANDFAKKWDAELNSVYKELMEMLPKEGRESLRTAQRAWIPWRDKELSLIGEVYYTIYNNLDGGTMWLVAAAIAEMEVVRTRTLELMYYINEIKLKSPYPVVYPEKQTDLQLAAAMRVKNESARLGKGLGNNGDKLGAANLAAWEDFRDKEVLFMAWLYGKKNDQGFARHNRMLMNNERIKRLESLFVDLQHGGLEESSVRSESKEEDKFKETYKGDRTLYQPTEGTCDFLAYIIDTDSKGTNVRDAPRGKVVTTLPYRPDDPDIITVRVTGHKNKWLSVVLHDGKTGWIFGELVGVSLRNYSPGAVAALRTRPDENAPSTGEIFGDEEVSIIGGEEKWALVQYKHPQGHVLTGWLDPVKHCPNPYTTCP